MVLQETTAAAVTRSAYSWAVSALNAETSQDVEPAAAIRLVLGVSRLGEADLAGWWSSQGLNPAVRFALAGFRRTSSIVGAELALLSATRRHQQVLPRPNAVHLFSPLLPFARWAHAHLAELKSVGESELIDELRSWTTPEDATGRIADWIAVAGPSPQQRSVVSSGDLASGPARLDLLVQLATGYIGQTGQLDIPYVDLSA